MVNTDPRYDEIAKWLPRDEESTARRKLRGLFEQLEACQDYAAEVERERDEWKQRAEVASVEDAHDRAERLQEQLQTTQNILVEERRWREEARVGELHAGDHARELQEQFDAAVAALEHIGSPNYAARPTGRDALDMAEAARTALRRIRQEEP